MRYTKLLKKALTISAAVSMLASSSFATDYTDPTTGTEFVLVKGGSFLMGDIYGKDPFAKPTHKVTVQDFYMSKHEVTFSQFDLFCKETKCTPPDDSGFGRGSRPIINVSWHDAVAYTKWLSKKSGKSVRLPSEAEWEYAARAGKNTNYWWGSTIAESMANCDGCGSQWDNQMTAPVGSLSPNPFGLYDMTGNVYEWCQDNWHETYEGAPEDGSAWLAGDETMRVSRGGTWNEPPSTVTSFARNWESPDEKNKTIGFRVVIEP